MNTTLCCDHVTCAKVISDLQARITELEAKVRHKSDLAAEQLLRAEHAEAASKRMYDKWMASFDAARRAEWMASFDAARRAEDALAELREEVKAEPDKAREDAIAWMGRALNAEAALADLKTERAKGDFLYAGQAAQEKVRAERAEAQARHKSDLAAEQLLRAEHAEAALADLRKLCDEYRANCDPKTTQAQVAEIFRERLDAARPMSADADDDRAKLARKAKMTESVPSPEFIARVAEAGDIRPVVAEFLTDDKLEYAAAMARTWAMNGDEYHGDLFGQIILAARWWRNGEETRKGEDDE